MRTTVRLDSLPEAVRQEVLKHGVRRGVRVEIEVADLNRITNQPVPQKTFGPIRLRTEFEIELITSLCPSCASFVNGRCASLKGCGCNRKPDDWARLSSHHCPEKKW